MACFSLAWLESLLIWAVIIGAAYAILKLLLPLVLQNFPGGALIQQILWIILWAVVLIVIIMFAFGLLSCLLGGAGSLLPPTPHR